MKQSKASTADALRIAKRYVNPQHLGDHTNLVRKHLAEDIIEFSSTVMIPQIIYKAHPSGNRATRRLSQRLSKTDSQVDGSQNAKGEDLLMEGMEGNLEK